ncbi:MAG: alkaline phosphatase [Saprospiraceae bacterium]|nr:alkaline phosphatase [Saprospiraceae bacterium]MCF8251316.1 alkaline phosphatase [Saprospiraceae bacterium]MCF8280617.1 alkaline phosphatase [Bacteroidales bacterium]MCF8313191.1 alkaline phosphatase [Saprospiraceae bacterium]MCF8441645.1 alkaline phosphatase [Saprospiraceae bacterium]
MKRITLFSLLLLVLSCNPKQTGKVGERHQNPSLIDDTTTFIAPKNIILMVGDGMGITQITAGMYLNGNKLNLEQFKYIGLHKSYSSSDLVTDSAAGATAFACGQKTYNGAVGVDKKRKPVQTILEEAEQNGLATGLVVTSSITHATPGSFYAHQKSREMVEEIAADMLKVDVDFFIGGGKKDFDRRKDGQNLIEQLTQKGYVISTFLDKDFQKIKNIDPTKNFGYFSADGEPLPFSQGRDYLVPASRSAVEFLSEQPAKGFFLMIEGSQIDWGGHANDSKYITSEMIEFDNAIGAVLDFAKKDGQTLVIVTADHETGGYAINPTSTMDNIVAAFTTDKHTAALIPVFAWGPGEELFSGIYENTAIYDKIRRAFGFDKKLP